MHLCGGCGTIPKTEKETSIPRLPPTSMGVRTNRLGTAIFEIDQPAQVVFEIAEDYLRKEFKVTFINRNLRKIDAKKKNILFMIECVGLTTGKTGLSVTALAGEDEKKYPFYEAARDLADEIAKTLKASPKKP